MDVIAQRFEIGRNPNGANLAAQWVQAQIQSQAATNVLVSTTYSDFDDIYLLILMSTTLVVNPAASIGQLVAAASFGVRNDLTSLATWLSAQVAGIPNPAAPVLTAINAGNLTGQGTLSVRLAYVDSTNNTTAAGPASQITLANDQQVVVAAPAQDAAGLATGYNVYIGAPNAEFLQNPAPIPFGSGTLLGWNDGGYGDGGFGGAVPAQNFTLTTPLATAVAHPTVNSTAAKYLKHFSLTERKTQKLVTVMVTS